MHFKLSGFDSLKLFLKKIFVDYSCFDERSFDLGGLPVAATPLCQADSKLHHLDTNSIDRDLEQLKHPSKKIPPIFIHRKLF